MGSVSGEHSTIMNSNMALFLKRTVYCHHVCLPKHIAQKLGGFTKDFEKTKKHTKRIEAKMVSVTQRDRQRASWIREHTKFEDILIIIKTTNGLCKLTSCKELITEEQPK